MDPTNPVFTPTQFKTEAGPFSETFCFLVLGIPDDKKNPESSDS
jgi:hypothetical protein